MLNMLSLVAVAAAVELMLTDMVQVAVALVEF